MTLFETLRADHDRQRTLIDLLVKTHGDSDGRAELFDKVREALSSHAEAEERYLYRPMMAHDATMEMARHSVAEHKELDDYLEQLENTDPSSPGWVATAKKLRERLLHHLDEEEHEVFQQAGRVLTDAQKTELAGAYRQMMERLEREAA